MCPGMIAIGFVQGRTSPCIYRHPEKQLCVCGYTETTLCPSVTSSTSGGFFCRTARVLGCHESRNPWDPLDTTTVCKAFECWAGLWNGPLMESPGRQILDMQSSSGNRFGVTGPISCDTWRQRTNSLTLKERFRSTKHRQIGIVPTPCVHSISPVTYLRYKSRDLARKMQQPSNLDEMGLKRLARFLGVRPRRVWLFKWQQRLTRTESWCGTDHAGCIRTRKSVSGCVLMLGGSTVGTYCKDRP